MRPKKLRPLLLLVGFGLTLILALALPARAAQESNPAPIGLQLSPAVLEVPYDEDGAERSLTLVNTGTEPVDVVTEVSEFNVTEDGTTQYRDADDLSAASWVTVDTPAFDLQPGQERKVTVTVEAPDDAEPGERYVSVLFAVPATDSGGNIALTHRLAAKLYLDVPGEATRGLQLGDLTTPRIIDGGPVRLSLTVHNRGNTHRRFEGADRLMATTNHGEIPFDHFTVLGDSARVVQGVWQDPPTFCLCTVDVQTDDGNGSPVVASTRLLVFPVRLTAGVIATAVGLAMLLSARRRRQAEHLHRQLEEARQEGFLAAQHSANVN